MTTIYSRAVSARRRSIRDVRGNWRRRPAGMAGRSSKPAETAGCLSNPAETAGLCTGFTLLEIILALAILAGSLVALGEVMRLGDQTAMLTEGETQAQILAASVMEELVSGARQLSTVSRASLVEDSDPPWVYSVDVQNTDFNELVAVRVTVEQQIDERLQPARFELVRWMPNPDFEASSSSEESSTTSSTSGTGGTTTTNGGVSK